MSRRLEPALAPTTTLLLHVNAPPMAWAVSVTVTGIGDTSPRAQRLGADRCRGRSLLASAPITGRS